MDYCLASNQIGNYEPSFSPSVSTRNIDCITLDADTIDCTNLTINGVPIDTELQHIFEATQHQTATAAPQTTTFTGEVNTDQVVANSLVTDDIQAPSGILTVNSPLTTTSTLTTSDTLLVNNTTATTTTQLAQLYCPNLTSGQVNAVIGKAVSLNNALVLQFAYTSSGSTSNYGSVALANQQGPQIFSTYTNIPNQLQIGGVITNPRQVGTMATLSGAGPFNFDFRTTLNIQKIVVSICDMNINGTATATPFLRWGYNNTYTPGSGGYSGFNYGDNGGASITWGATGIPLWNSANLPASPASYFISGTIEFTYAGLVGGFQKWTVKGYIGTPNAVSTAGPYHVFISGVCTTVAGYPTFNSVQIAKNSTNFTSGYCNVLYY